MRIIKTEAQAGWKLVITAADGRQGCFDVGPYLQYEAFKPLADHQEFCKVANGGYFVEWACGADLSADTIEAGWVPNLA